MRKTHNFKARKGFSLVELVVVIIIIAVLAVAVFALSPLIYELLHRIPFVRWAVFGEKKAA